MPDELDALLGKVDDLALRANLRAEIDRVRAKQSFGLVFESHLPERVRLPDHPVRRGVTVVRRENDEDALLVRRVRDGTATLIGPDNSTEEVDVSDLVVVAEFGQPIYPGLARLRSVDRGGDKPAHIVINAENYHALEALQFTHAGESRLHLHRPALQHRRKRLEVRQQLCRRRRRLSALQVAGVHGTPPRACQASLEPRGLGAHRDGR